MEVVPKVKVIQSEFLHLFEHALHMTISALHGHVFVWVLYVRHVLLSLSL